MSNEKSIPVGENTIGIAEQRNLIVFSRNLGSALNKDEYAQIMMVFNNAVNRLVRIAEKEGIEI